MSLSHDSLVTGSWATSSGPYCLNYVRILPAQLALKRNLSTHSQQTPAAQDIHDTHGDSSHANATVYDHSTLVPKELMSVPRSSKLT